MFKTILTLGLMMSFSAFGQNKEQSKYQITSKTIAVEQLEAPINSRPLAVAPGAGDLAGDITGELGELLNPLNQAEILVDKIINMGQKVWNIVEKGKPVSNYQQYTATALPQGVTNWQQMQGWAGKSMTQEIAIVNGFGSEKVKFTYRLVFMYNGNVGAKGKYIGYATIEPADIFVGWGGFKFNANVSVPTVFNMGTVENPVAGMKIQIKYSADTIIDHIESTDSFIISGSGKLTRL